MRAYAGLGKRWLRCGCGSREGVGAELELASAAVTGYAALPQVCPNTRNQFRKRPPAHCTESVGARREAARSPG
jgi:hypothetical protein